MISYRSGHETYGDTTIGYVQVKQEGELCSIKCRICPEHKVRDKNYTVTAKIDEKEDRVLDLQCHDCAAAAGELANNKLMKVWHSYIPFATTLVTQFTLSLVI